MYLMKNIFVGIASPVATDDVKQKHCTSIAQFFYHNQKRNGIYGARYIVCETINLANVIIQIILIDNLLGGEFSTYGLKEEKYLVFIGRKGLILKH